LKNIKNTDLSNIENLDNVIASQLNKLDNLREKVRDLNFVPVDPMGEYETIAYKAIDGGRMRIYFDPFEIELVDVFDSYGNLKIKFLIPSSIEETEKPDLSFLEENAIIKSFLKIFEKDHISEISEIFYNSDTLMEISEWACIFEKILNNQGDPLLILRDGLLRTKKIKSELIEKLIDVIKQKKDRVWLVGVSKKSKVMSLLSTAMFMEHKFPKDQIGFIKIPPQLEVLAYNWSGRGRINEGNDRLYFSFGNLYIAKLSKISNLLVTIEIPRDMKRDEDIYSDREIKKIIGHLAKDSKYSYPILGYPQTIMKAHEFAVNIGFPASVIRDKILDRIQDKLDDDGREFMRDAYLLKEEVDKDGLGGGSQ